MPRAATLAFLEIRAWLDRPEERDKDLVDLAYLLRRYVGDVDLRLWDPDVPDDVDHDDKVAFLLGADLGGICQEHHRVDVDAFLDRLTPTKLSAAGPWNVDPVAEARSALAAFRRGIELGSSRTA